MPLHPQAAAVFARLPEVWRDLDAIASMTAEKARALEGEIDYDAGLDGDAADIAVEVVEMTGVDGPLRAAVHRPTSGSLAGTVVWNLGGGFVLPPMLSKQLAASVARASACAVVSVDYRLAPEHPFPAALEDCYSVFCWAAEHARELGGGFGPVAIGGDSAGGNLAAAVTLLARSRSGPEIAFQVLLEPMLSRGFGAPSRRDPELSAVVRAEAIEWFWQQYLGDEDDLNPLACPLHARTLAGLPPALVVTAEHDVLRDEGEAYARRLAEDGVPVELVRYDGVFHSFELWPGVIDAADECLARVGGAFQRALRAES